MKKLPGNLLIEAASRRGSVADAQRAFDTIPAPNLYSWNLLLAAYAQNGHLWQARRVLACMPAPNVVSWNVLLSACSRRGRPDEARQLFHWMPQHDTVSWNTVEHMFAASGHCRDARQTFDAMPQRSVLSWNTLVSAYAFQRQLRDARLVLDLMPARNSISVNTMIKGYASAGALHAAALLFSAMPNRDLVSWNSMLTAASCWQQHQRLWHRMPRWDVVSCNARIQACLGSSLHADEGAATFWAMPGRDVVSWNTAAAGYARLGRPRHARRLLELMPQRDLVSANCWLHYCCHTPGATKLGFDAMPQRDSASWNSMLASCELPVADELFWRRMPAWDVISCTLMVAAYGRSLGGMDAAGRAFAAMQHRDVAAWTAIISAYATHGDCARAVAQSWGMALDGLEPNYVTYTVLLHACAQAGLLEQGAACLAAAGVTVADEQHYSCCVDMLARAKQLAAAEELIAAMPVPPTAVTWTAMLSACRVQGDVQRADTAAAQLLDLDPASALPYVLLLSVYTEAGRTEEATALRRLMSRRGVMKMEPGTTMILLDT
ncbi:hypothetical protein SELMODRAFT_108400 [Selaginella moellendorffii]|uniref:Pentacotripeptide-repeat region of PRORP domain-containing protein n=1 Tax=Selaginella moellendorffii TaxID=88036 RepID=D8S4P5_SELML|nr:hypothetical protein SELMODRAFT_108400 [Selaginella moellendorffii]